MNLQSVTLSLALLASTSAMAQEPPPRLGATRTPDTAKVKPAEQAGAPAENADKVADQTGDKAADKPVVRRKRLPQPDNPLDPNQPRKSTREPAKIRPSEHSAVPAENTKPVVRRPAAGDGSKNKAKDAAEPAKIRPAEQAVTPTENTDKVDDKATVKPEVKPDAKPDKQANRPAPRRAVSQVVATMPPTLPTVTYGPRLDTQVGVSPNLANPLPTGVSNNLPGSVSNTPIAPVAPNRPAIVNS